jgi:23S rRNA pseudouridine2604 synthase
MRLNRYLAERGYATRRGADELITAGRVLVNGFPAVLGTKVQENDRVEVREGRRAKKAEYAYFAFNKPRGAITHEPGGATGKPNGSLPPELAAVTPPLFPIGRLDKESHGLLLLTNDGRVTDRLLNPERDHEKEYVVRTKLPMRQSFKQHMEAGVMIEGYCTKPAKVRILGEHSFSILLTEGKKHQIRRMVVAMHNDVTDLKRSRILNIRLGSLKSGEGRRIEGVELEEFLSLLGLGKQS